MLLVAVVVMVVVVVVDLDALADIFSRPHIL